MKVEVKVGNIADWKDEAIVVNLFEGVKKTGGAMTHQQRMPRFFTPRLSRSTS